MPSQVGLNSAYESIVPAKPIIEQCPLLGDFRIEAAYKKHEDHESCEENGEAEDRRASSEALEKAGLLDFLSRLEGEFKGSGYNTIFRPMNSVTPTPQFECQTLQGNEFKDNVLELNLTKEHWTFTRDLGEVPNRGLFEQGDIDLHGLSYVQRVADVSNTRTGEPTACPKGIHFEPGLFMYVPASKNPSLGPTISRMASIPHGTTINLLGHAPTKSALQSGEPSFENDKADITPFRFKPGPGPKKEKVPVEFLSQKVDQEDTPRLPQNLSPFVLSKTIDEEIMANPNEVLRRANLGKNIANNFAFKMSSKKINDLNGGGITNIPFLLGNPKPNAVVADVEATFWISTVLYEVQLPRFKPCKEGDYIDLKPIDTPADKAHAVPTFRLTWEVEEPRELTVAATQFQYSQTVMLDFNRLSWPHVSVATLLPAQPLEIPRKD